MQTINKIGELTLKAKSVRVFWNQLLAGLESNHDDVPFAILYSVGDSEDVAHSEDVFGSFNSSEILLLRRLYCSASWSHGRSATT
jgi:hypothetical protein